MRLLDGKSHTNASPLPDLRKGRRDKSSSKLRLLSQTRGLSNIKNENFDTGILGTSPKILALYHASNNSLLPASFVVYYIAYRPITTALNSSKNN